MSVEKAVIEIFCGSNTSTDSKGILCDKVFGLKFKLHFEEQFFYSSQTSNLRASFDIKLTNN